MVLLLRQDQRDAAVAHAESTYPDECCGLLLGTLDAGGDRRVQLLRSLSNMWTAEINPFAETPAPDTPQTRQNRYWIDPKDLMEAQRESRDRGWIVLGVYHSHPDHVAVPSARDLQLAWSEYSYPILSVVNGKVADIQCWRLGANGEFMAEAIKTVPHEFSR